MIVKNESEHLTNCLDCAQKIVDEIIIVDTGSADSTKEIAKRYTDQVYDFEWCDDFSAARNYAYSFATQDYILWLDADDIIDDENVEKFLTLKENLTDEDAVMMRYATQINAQGVVTFSFFRERLTKRANNYRWHEPVHEYLDKSGKVVQADVMIKHNKHKDGYSDRNLRIYEKQIEAGKTLSTRGLYYYARELSTFGRFKASLDMYQEYFARADGWIEDNISACEGMAACYSAMGDDDKALVTLFGSFAYDTPRAEICCKIGYIYKKQQNWTKALFWFRTVLTLEKPTTWGFIRDEFWDYIPLAELVVCFDKLGDIDSAEEYNEKVAAIRPNSASVEYNRQYFSQLKRRT
jgi:glycosyltransferase involved in cell wall biosynthesis